MTDFLKSLKMEDILVRKEFIKNICQSLKLGDNCIKNFHLERYMVGNLVLQRHANVYLPK